ncbi:MAG: hypothetical protein ABI610_01105, partial [Acidobacteriota bacterium]
MKSRLLHLLAVMSLCVIATVACKKKTETVALPPPSDAPVAQVPAAGARVERITVAKAVNADDSPGAMATTFAKGDTVYVSMWTAGAPVGTEVMARWFGPDGQQITEDKIMTDRAADGYT